MRIIDNLEFDEIMSEDFDYGLENKLGYYVLGAGSVMAGRKLGAWMVSDASKLNHNIIKKKYNQGGQRANIISQKQLVELIGELESYRSKLLAELNKDEDYRNLKKYKFISELKESDKDSMIDLFNINQKIDEKALEDALKKKDKWVYKFVKQFKEEYYTEPADVWNIAEFIFKQFFTNGDIAYIVADAAKKVLPEELEKETSPFNRKSNSQGTWRVGISSGKMRVRSPSVEDVNEFILGVRDALVDINIDAESVVSGALESYYAPLLTEFGIEDGGRKLTTSDHIQVIGTFGTLVGVLSVILSDTFRRLSTRNLKRSKLLKLPKSEIEKEMSEICDIIDTEADTILNQLYRDPMCKFLIDCGFIYFPDNPDIIRRRFIPIVEIDPNTPIEIDKENKRIVSGDTYVNFSDIDKTFLSKAITAIYRPLGSRMVAASKKILETINKVLQPKLSKYQMYRGVSFASEHKTEYHNSQEEAGYGVMLQPTIEIADGTEGFFSNLFGKKKKEEPKTKVITPPADPNIAEIIKNAKGDLEKVGNAAIQKIMKTSQYKAFIKWAENTYDRNYQYWANDIDENTFLHVDLEEYEERFALISFEQDFLWCDVPQAEALKKVMLDELNKLIKKLPTKPGYTWKAEFDDDDVGCIWVYPTQSSGSTESRIVEAIYSKYGIEGLTEVIKNISK